MGAKHSAKQDDEVYNTYSKFRDRWTLSGWLNLWCEIYTRINDIFNTENKIPIVELGCGSGQFAEMLKYFKLINWENYKGYDHSKVAISIAKEKLGEEFDFYVQDIEKMKPNMFFPGKNLIVSLEGLEHVDDYAVLSRIPQGSTIIASVPDCDSKSHIRFFKNVAQVEDRYKKYIKLEYIHMFQYFYILKGDIL